MNVYHFHGVRICSELDLGLPASENIPHWTLADLEIRWGSGSPVLPEEPLWVDPQHFADGTPLARLFLVEGLVHIEAHEAAIFRLEGATITVFPRGEEHDAVPYLLGRVFALWLEQQGFPLLHGGCFLRSDGVAALLGDSGMGKSTLSAALVNHGHRLLTDDLIPLYLDGDTVPILPGIPMSRIWPTSGVLVPQFEEQPLIHPRSRKRKVFVGADGGPRFSSEPGLLHTIYVLQRSLADTPLHLETLPPASALMELVRLSYRPELVQLLGLQPARLKILAEVVKRVKVVRLIYPTGFDNLNAVCAAIGS